MDEHENRRSSYPLTIPDALLQSEAMQQACAARNFREIFRLVNRRTGTSHAAMAAAIGKMTSSRVSDVIRGVRGIRGQEVMERVADGFGIPGEMLGLPRRPWQGSPEDSVRPEASTYPDSADQKTSGALPIPRMGDSDEINIEYSDLRGDDFLSDSHDMLLVSVWIEGRKQLMAINRRSILAGTVGGVLQGVGISQVPVLESGSALKSASFPKLKDSQVDAAIEHLQDMWHALVRMDNLFGPRHALASVHQQLSILESLLEHVRGNQRHEVLGLASKYAESAAWLHEDSADMASAEKWTRQAMEWATESGDQLMVSWTLFRRSQQATTRKNAAQTISLAQSVQRNAAALTAPVRAAARQQEAHGYALDGDERACQQRLDEAHAFAASPDAKGDGRTGHGDFCTPSYIEIQRANCWLTMSRPDRAVPVFERALVELPDVYQRDRGLAQVRLSMAYAGIGEYDAAATEAASALQIARISGSTRTLNEAVSVANAIGVKCDSPAVANLITAVRSETEF
ncbi:hypothetical protein ACFC09_14425 [Streptomyces sp. NPDC056161]|uniref:hypothetical protein n=1 Tax=Streptomyces sp. NPDC056161 TaxID=3345732 RepID=UPI0035E09322